MERNPTIYIRRRTDCLGVWFDVVEKRNGRFESLIYPRALDYRGLEWMQNNGCVLVDADFITHEMVLGN